MTNKERENRLEKIMSGLKCSREEAEEILEYDKETDKMTDSEIMAELTPEQRKAQKEATKCGTRKVTGTVKRERKPNEDKQSIITALADGVNGIAENLTITNKEREFTFSVGGVKYKVVLSAPRS